MKHFDVVVIGGGHAGLEAACAAGRFGASVALVTMSARDVGTMSCNPAIGGVGKGHLAREIDALDGVLAGMADAAAIQYRLLNRGRGPAVQGPRVQADRRLFREAGQSVLQRQPNVSLVEGEVVDLTTEGTQVTGVTLADGSTISARAVVIASGTFLGARIHIGYESRAAGRIGDPSALRLAARIRDLGLTTGTLKTGTPPRLDTRTINWASVGLQAGDAEPSFMSFATTRAANRQVDCGITATNDRTHAIIRDNLVDSAVYGGRIDGVGPRYCPSIEDKVVRFADRDAHQVFLEPEGLDSDLVYPNGISTSLPAETQIKLVRSMHGLERAEIVQPGYAVEYDYVRPTQLEPTLAVRALGGLFLAGQINGTTGYEEAAAQGLVAGINAARSALGQEAVRFSRTDSYIGVMIDDLIGKDVSEPYRMFTSRAEYRLSLRADNADQRLTPLGRQMGIVSDQRWRQFESRQEALAALHAQTTDERHAPDAMVAHGIEPSFAARPRTGIELLAHGEPGHAAMLALSPAYAAASADLRTTLQAQAIYAPYLHRQVDEIAVIRADEAMTLPPDFDYAALPALSNELRGKLDRIRPASIGAAARIEGMTPAALAMIAFELRRATRKSHVA